jgi:uncharacterized protein YdeI (YjbR/CyaY-like superfamily)
MKKLYFAKKDQWRKWLSKNYDSPEGILLLFYKKQTRKPTISYDDAVEQALCFGWIDGIIKKNRRRDLRPQIHPEKTRQLLVGP